jgi:exosortase
VARSERARRLRIDLVVAASVGLAFGLSPLTSADRLLPSIVGGCLAAAAVFAVRARGARPAPTGAVEVRVPPLAWALALALAVAFAPTAAGLYRWYTDSVWQNGHGFFVPILMVLLAVPILRRDASQPGSSAWGWLPFAGGLVLVVLDSGVVTFHLGVLGLVLVLVGASLLLLGARRTRALALPLALGLFLLPLPTSLTGWLHLPLATAAATETLLEWVGLPVLRFGTVLSMPASVFGVTVRCSGFSAVYAGLGLALVLGACGRSRLRAAWLLVSVWPLVWAANSLRSAVLMYVCEKRGLDMLHTPLHGLSGIAAFLAVMLALYLMSDRRAVREALA